MIQWSKFHVELINVGLVCNQPMQDYHVTNIDELVNTKANKNILYAQLWHLPIESWDWGQGQLMVTEKAKGRHHGIHLVGCGTSTPV